MSFVRPPAVRRAPVPDAYWAVDAAALATALGSGADGLSSDEAARRLAFYGPNAPSDTKRTGAVRLFLGQFESPLILMLIGAAVISGVVMDWTDAAIVLSIVFGSGVLGFLQEYQASRAVEALRARVRVTCKVLRGGAVLDIPSREVVPGDVVQLSAGSLIPADGVLLEAKDFFVSQAVLTGESFPTEKTPGANPADASIAERMGSVFMGTSVRSGTAKMLVAHTGAATVLGGIAGKLRLAAPETEFERGIRRYGYLLMQVMLTMSLAIFAANVFLHRGVVESLLFAVALAVGLSPELLPAIVSITLSQGARAMAAKGVIVQRLAAIENLGSMDVLCTDKTGTLTSGVLSVDAALDARGAPSAATLEAAYVNAAMQTGLANPMDDAIAAKGREGKIDLAQWRKLDEVPYDFVRKRLSVLAAPPQGQSVLVVKGALDNVLEICASAAGANGAVPLDDAGRAAIAGLFASYSGEGFRVIGVARKEMGGARCTRDDETGLTFLGFLLFKDPPKDGIRETLDALAKLGVGLKVITGDNRLAAAHLAKSVGIEAPRLLTGRELNDMRDEALWGAAEHIDVFAEIDPNQKERIVLALKRIGHVVGYMGDGINDAPALHAADVGISVDQAVDVAKQAADFVLLERDLGVLAQGIAQGRMTFSNTLKYIAIVTSGNFGNMISMAATSLFLPFLPLLARQILLNNFLADVPAMAIAGDNVDADLVARPRRWDIAYLRRFMLIFGPISSAFDFLTFGVLLFAFHAPAALFRTAWFVESLLTELAVLFVVRTFKPFYKSKPGKLLRVLAALTAVVAVAIPYLPGAGFFAFVPLPPAMLATLIGITILYVAAAEFGKRLIYR